MVSPMEEHFKRYLIVCEYMQIDPCHARTAEFVKERAEHILSRWNEDDDKDTLNILKEEFGWFVKEYEKLTGKGLLKRDFAYRCSLFLKEKHFRIHAGTVNKVYVKRELRHLNCDSYIENAENRRRR